MPENQTETPFWKNKTVIGSVVAVVCGILSFCGIDISADTQSVITDNLSSIRPAIATLFRLYTPLKAK